MHTLKCLIVDDEAPARRIIEGYLMKLDGIEITGKAKNAIEAFNILQKSDIDLIFLDITMPEISGMGLLKMLKEPPIVILTTAYSEYAIESYEYNVADYLLKPIRFERFVKAVEKARAIKQQQAIADEPRFTSDHFEFKTDRSIKKVPLAEILYLQSLGNYVKVFVKDKAYLTLQTTKETEDALPSTKFIRIHKSFIVNTERVEKVDNESVQVAGLKLPIGKTYKKYFLEKLAKLKQK